MMHIITNTKLDPKGLDEITTLLGTRPTVEETDKTLKTKKNPYFNTIWGDFDWIRSLFTYKYDVRCFVTTFKQIEELGITGHMGMYDLVDNDGVLDFYFGLPRKLDKRAEANGFKTNLAWLFCHEWCHGKEQFSGSPDRTDPMDKQGRLKELIAEHVAPKKKDTLVEMLKRLLTLLIGLRVAQEDEILSGLTPETKEKAIALIEAMARQGHFIDITSGYRNKEQQDALYAQGRTTPGPIVTNAKWGQSSHNFRTAFDVAFLVNEQPSWAEHHPWNLLGAEGRKLGLEWGGSEAWKKAGFLDRPHFEMIKT